MIDFIKLQELITNSEEVYITAHKNIDLDALGSILGLYYVCSSYDKGARIVIDDKETSPEIRRAINGMKKQGINSYEYDDIKNKLNDRALLVILDTHQSRRLQNEKLLRIDNKVVIDHHVETEDSIDTLYKYINTKSSSTCEMVLELIKKLNIVIPSEIATIMLAGIYIDTNAFVLKTTKNTHLCVSSLYEFGADNIEVQYLLKQNYEEFRRRQKLTLNTEFYKNYAISLSDETFFNTELAKASDVTLTFNNVEASFSIGKLNCDTIGISARSIGNIDVSKIMNYFNGGGHKTDAAAQIKGNDVIKVKNDLLEYLGGLDESNIY